MKRISIYILSAVSMLVLMAVTASPTPAEQNRPCAEDMKKYCSSVSPGGGRLLQCYEQQKKNMSAECVAWAESLKKNAVEVKAACKAETDMSCNSEKGDPFAMLNCIQANYTRLSQKCIDKLNQFKYYYPLPAQ